MKRQRNASDSVHCWVSFIPSCAETMSFAIAGPRSTLYLPRQKELYDLFRLDSREARLIAVASARRQQVLVLAELPSCAPNSDENLDLTGTGCVLVSEVGTKDIAGSGENQFKWVVRCTAGSISRFGPPRSVRLRTA